MDLTHNDTKVHRSYSSVSVGFKHTILFSLSIHLILNHIISMPQYIPRRGRGMEKEGGKQGRMKGVQRGATAPPPSAAPLPSPH